MQKYLLVLMLAGTMSARAQYDTNLYAIPDKTPNMGTNGWAFPETPGEYYWSGLRTALVMGFFCLVIGAGVRYWARD